MKYYYLKEIFTFFGSLGGLAYLINVFLLWKNRRRLRIYNVRIQPQIIDIEITNRGDNNLSLEKRVLLSSVSLQRGNIKKAEYLIEANEYRKFSGHETKTISAINKQLENDCYNTSDWYIKLTVCQTTTLFGKAKAFYRCANNKSRIRGWRFYLERCLFRNSSCFQTHIVNKNYRDLTKEK